MSNKNGKFHLKRELLEQLASTGSPVNMRMAEDRECHALEIRQTGGYYDSKIFELEDGRLGFMADLTFTNQGDRAIYITHIELRSAVIDDSFEWLEPRDFPFLKRTKGKSSYGAYAFPGRCGLELPFDDVLNHKILGNGVLPTKRPLEGWLLGIGGPMPRGLLHGPEIRLPIIVTGSDHSEYKQDLHLFVELNLEPHKFIKRRSSLFEETTPDAVTRADLSDDTLGQNHSTDSDRDNVSPTGRHE